MNEDVAFCVVRKALMLLKTFAGLGSSSAFATFQKWELRDSLSREMPMCAGPGAWLCYCTYCILLTWFACVFCSRENCVIAQPFVVYACVLTHSRYLHGCADEHASDR